MLKLRCINLNYLLILKHFDSAQCDISNTNFFKTEFIPLEKGLLESMSLKGMLEEILGLTENHYWENV